MVFSMTKKKLNIFLILIIINFKFNNKKNNNRV